MLAKFYNWTEAALYTDAETALHHKSTLVERLREKMPPVIRSDLRGNISWADAYKIVLDKYDREVINCHPSVTTNSTSKSAKHQQTGTRLSRLLLLLRLRPRVLTSLLLLLPLVQRSRRRPRPRPLRLKSVIASQAITANGKGIRANEHTRAKPVRNTQTRSIPTLSVVKGKSSRKKRQRTPFR